MAEGTYRAQGTQQDTGNMARHMRHREQGRAHSHREHGREHMAGYREHSRSQGTNRAGYRASEVG
jgi:hypothetical protein